MNLGAHLSAYGLMISSVMVLRAKYWTALAEELDCITVNILKMLE